MPGAPWLARSIGGVAVLALVAWARLSVFAGARAGVPIGMNFVRSAAELTKVRKTPSRPRSWANFSPF
jgi:hypothetical protein